MIFMLVFTMIPTSTLKVSAKAAAATTQAKKATTKTAKKTAKKKKKTKAKKQRTVFIAEIWGRGQKFSAYSKNIMNRYLVFKWIC